MGLGDAMKANKTLTAELFRLHRALQTFSARPGQAHWANVAAAIGATGDRAALIQRFGVVLVENGKAPAQETRFLVDYLATVDPDTHAVEFISQREYLSDATGTSAGLRSTRSGCNIYAGVWWAENPFPSDCDVCSKPATPAGLTFGEIVAHEIMGHNSLDQKLAKAYNDRLHERKYRIIHRGAGPDIRWNNFTNRMDWAATEEHFKSRGLMQGGDIRAAVRAYYEERPELNKNNLRSMVHYDYWLEAPQ